MSIDPIYLRPNEKFSSFDPQEVTGATDFDGTQGFQAEQQCLVMFYIEKPTTTALWITQTVHANNSPKVVDMLAVEADPNGVFGPIPAEPGEQFKIYSSGAVSGVKNVLPRVVEG